MAIYFVSSETRDVNHISNEWKIVLLTLTPREISRSWDCNLHVVQQFVYNMCFCCGGNDYAMKH